MKVDLRAKVNRRYVAARREGKTQHRDSWTWMLAVAGTLAAIGLIVAFIVLV